MTSPRRNYSGGRQERSGGVSRALVGVIALVIVAVIVVVVVVVTSGGSSHKHNAPSTASQTTAAKGKTKTKSKSRPVAPAVDPAKVTVAVLNATQTPLLAQDVQNQLNGSHFKPGYVGNAVNQTMTTTLVGYLPGFKADAQAVAKALKLPASTVGPIDSGNRTAACASSPTNCPDDVVVVTGSDLNSLASSSQSSQTTATTP